MYCLGPNEWKASGTPSHNKLIPFLHNSITYFPKSLTVASIDELIFSVIAVESGHAASSPEHQQQNNNKNNFYFFPHRKAKFLMFTQQQTTCGQLLVCCSLLHCLLVFFSVCLPVPPLSPLSAPSLLQITVVQRWTCQLRAPSTVMMPSASEAARSLGSMKQ